MLFIHDPSNLLHSIYRTEQDDKVRKYYFFDAMFITKYLQLHVLKIYKYLLNHLTSNLDIHLLHPSILF